MLNSPNLLVHYDKNIDFFQNNLFFNDFFAISKFGKPSNMASKKFHTDEAKKTQLTLVCNVCGHIKPLVDLRQILHFPEK